MEMRGRTVCKDGLEGVYAVCDDQACTGLCQLFLGTPSLVFLPGFFFRLFRLWISSSYFSDSPISCDSRRTGSVERPHRLCWIGC